MEEHVDQVMWAGFQSEELNVRHMRQPGERMPVAGVACGEGPSYVIECDTTNVNILDDVVHIVVIQKFVLSNGKINTGGNERENEAEEKLLSHWALTHLSLDHCFVP